MAVPILRAKPGDYKKLAWIPVLIVSVGLIVVAIAFIMIEGGKTENQPSTPGQVQTPSPGPGDVYCTMEAKLCPDGSAVGRTGPNCEFAPCPGE